MTGMKSNGHSEKGKDSERDGNQQITRTNKIPRINNNLATETVSHVIP